MDKMGTPSSNELMNREFMVSRQSLVKADYDHRLDRRIKDRKIGELEREKKLILEGKMVVDDAPYIADHPVFKVSKMTNSILEERRLKVEEKFKPKLTKSPNYDEMRGGTGWETEDDLESFVELDEEEVERARRLWEVERQIEDGNIFTKEDYDKIKYEEPLVKKLRTVETVAELYHLADQIVGPVSHFVKQKKRHG